MRIGLDLDGTLYAHPEFFTAMIECMHGWQGHTFFCISSHARGDWDDPAMARMHGREDSDMNRLGVLGVPWPLISTELMSTEGINQVSVEGVMLKAKMADKCDIVFDDDERLQQYTKTPVFRPMK